MRIVHNDENVHESSKPIERREFYVAEIEVQRGDKRAGDSTLHLQPRVHWVCVSYIKVPTYTHPVKRPAALAE